MEPVAPVASYEGRAEAAPPLNPKAGKMWGRELTDEENERVDRMMAEPDDVADPEAAPPRATTPRCAATNRDGYQCELQPGHRGTLHRALIGAFDEQGTIPQVKWREIADGVVEPWSCEASCVDGGYPALCYMYPNESHDGCPRAPSRDSGALLDARALAIRAVLDDALGSEEIWHENGNLSRAAIAAYREKHAHAVAALATLERDAARMRGEVRAADALAAAVLSLVERKVIGARSDAGDALLDYAQIRHPDTEALSEAIERAALAPSGE